MQMQKTPDQASMKKPLRIGLVGAGRIGRVHARAIMALDRDEAHLCLVADTDQDAAEQLAIFANAQVCSSAEFCQSGDMDAAIIATPPNTHEALCLPLLARGIAVLCEKPLGVSLEAAVRMQQASEKSGALLCVSSKFVFAESVVALAALIQRGDLRASTLSLDFSLALDLAGSWQVDPAVGGGGVARDRGPQTLDLVRALLGEPSDIVCPRPEGSPYAVEDEVAMRVVLRDVRHADCRLSWRQTGETDVYARLTCENAIIDLGWREARIWRPEAGWRRLGPGYDQHQAFTDQCRSFIRAARGTGEFAAPLAGAVANQVLIDQIYLSWRDEARRQSA